MKGKRKKTPTFITEFALKTSSYDKRILNSRFHAASQIMNAITDQFLKRLTLVRESKVFQQALKLVRGSKERRALFAEANGQFGLTESDSHSYVKDIRKNGHFEDRIESDVAQKLASRKFDAVMQYAYGKKGKPRFRPASQVKSVEGKTNNSSIRWRHAKNKGAFHWRVEWSGLSMKAIIDPKDPVHMYALGQPVKFVRIVRRKYKGEWRYFTQLVHEGYSYRKESRHPMGKGVVGLDLGPSTIAVVAPEAETVILERFCEELEGINSELRTLQRKLDRQKRTNNPDNYEYDGRITKGKKKWTKSNSERKTEAEIADLQRKLAATRDSMHGQKVNQLLALGDTFMLENVSYRSFQRNFGKSTGFRAPGKFVERLVRKAERAGGQVVKFSTYSTALSQSCLCTEERTPKSLRDRWHSCECGIEGQRDVVSAFLSCFVKENEDGVERLVRAEAKQYWPGVDALLRAAQVSVTTQAAISRAMPEHLRVSYFQGSEPLAAEDQPVSSEALGGCSHGSRTVARAGERAILERTPFL